ncbi:hypothetical protein Shyhy01_75450 [Streptomyces hygroscopicus subsp. hygroscopicus]|nr:hypothetical protein Shyhy01_75450 [Streptomyces hygroscopicus subsp. hygroscopicus]
MSHESGAGPQEPTRDLRGRPQAPFSATDEQGAGMSAWADGIAADNPLRPGGRMQGTRPYPK